MEAECLEQCNCCKSRVKVRMVKSGVDGPRNTPVRKGWVAEKSLQRKTRHAIAAFLLLMMFLATNDSIYFKGTWLMVDLWFFQGPRCSESY